MHAIAEQSSTLNTPVSAPSRRSVISSNVHCLTDFFMEDVNLAVWQRKSDISYAGFVDNFAARSGSLQRFVSIEADEVANDILPDWARAIPGAGAWLSDINTVIDMFRCLFEPSAVGVRLHVLTGTMCPRFHVDRVPARLLLTYSGKGTEWLTEDQVIRGAEGTRLPDQTARAEEIQVIPTEAVAILKGELWEGNEGFGLVHRSPDPENIPRLVLALDWLS
jgi:hypothetical protein